MHASYAARWGIDMAGVEPASATLAYTEFLLGTAATGGVGMVFAAMTPCMRLYAWLGAALDAGAAGPYAKWVQPTPTRASRHWHRGWNDCSTNTPMTGQLCARPTGGRCAWSWHFSTQRSYPQAEHHLGCRGRQATYCSTSESKPASADMTIQKRTGESRRRAESSTTMSLPDTATVPRPRGQTSSASSTSSESRELRENLWVRGPSVRSRPS